MQRVFNEYRSDSKRKANFGHGGVKVGDFGTGGRVYERGYTVSSSTPAQQGRQRQGVSFCCGFIALVLLVASRVSADETHASGAHPAPLSRAPTAPRVI